jgi:hypothetical protein
MKQFQCEANLPRLVKWVEDASNMMARLGLAFCWICWAEWSVFLYILFKGNKGGIKFSTMMKEFGFQFAEE